jgi:hypothetical protein
MNRIEAWHQMVMPKCTALSMLSLAWGQEGFTSIANTLAAFGVRTAKQEPVEAHSS